MKKIFIFFLLLLCGKISAQVDSVVVEGHYLKIPVPKDWYVAEKSDGISDDTSWNAVMNYGINNPGLFARLAFKVTKRKLDNSPTRLPKKVLIQSGYTPMGSRQGGYVEMISPRQPCNFCTKTYTYFDVYYLNDELDLVTAFSATGPVHLMDSLTKYYRPFIYSLFQMNGQSINAFTPLSCKTANSIDDSIRCSGRYFRFSRTPDWECTALKDTAECSQAVFRNKLKLSRSTQNGLVIVSVDALDGNAFFHDSTLYLASPSLRPRNENRFDPSSKTSGSNPIEQRMKNPWDTPSKPPVQFHPAPGFHGLELSFPMGYCQDVVIRKGNTNSYYTLHFSLCVGRYSSDELLQDYYEDFLRLFVSNFLATNGISEADVLMSPIKNISDPKAPAIDPPSNSATPNPPKKRTTVE